MLLEINPGNVLSYGGATAVLLALGYVLVSMLTQNRKINDVYREEMATLRRELRRSIKGHSRCNYRLSKVITACVKGGIEVPDDVWANGDEDDEHDEHDEPGPAPTAGRGRHRRT